LLLLLLGGGGGAFAGAAAGGGAAAAGGGGGALLVVVVLLLALCAGADTSSAGDWDTRQHRLAPSPSATTNACGTQRQLGTGSEISNHPSNGSLYHARLQTHR
jgi:predicted metalloprotease